ncbi:MAG: NADP-dependent malic enzyme [Deltaproteobacteria bacterium]|nr:NADP-dependent malic enzyme [Candidatus Anaeroferrophillus wilburensis]MBN2888446.1 NADP-dependent malic enzyme [Deltaproteobacteria bacterium]
MELREKYRGLIGVRSKVPIKDTSVLSLVYTPGVGSCCQAIAEDSTDSFIYTMRANTVGLFSNGSAVFGLGNVGARAAIPMLEGVSVLFKTFAGIDALPLAVDTDNPDDFVEIARVMAPTMGAICLEDIASPDCFAIVERLRRAVRLPVFHNDHHGSAIVVLAALGNALKVAGKELSACKIVINGAGAAGVAVARSLVRLGAGEVIVCDRAGAIYRHRTAQMNWVKSELSFITNAAHLKGSLAEVLPGADVFIGLSSGGVFQQGWIAAMAAKPVIFALALPEPEIDYLTARKAGAFIVATGNVNHPNYLTSSLVFPGFFRGALDAAAWRVTWEMELAAVRALQEHIPADQLNEVNIIPRLFDFSLAPEIACQVAQAAVREGVNRKSVEPEKVKEKLLRYVYEGELSILPASSRRKKRSGPSLSLDEQSLELHKRYMGVVGIEAKIPLKDTHLASMLYSAVGVSETCRLIVNDPDRLYDLTAKSNLVAVVSDGSAVLGFGNIGPRAAMPVMEGKSILFKTFGGVEALPICIDTQEVSEIIRVVEAISPGFGGINLEDISAPRCFEIERQLRERLDIPVFHDDQHGTAVVTLAGMINALKIVGKKAEQIKVVVNGAGAGATAVTKLLLTAGISNIIMCDTVGAIFPGRLQGMNPYKEEMARLTNPEKIKGLLAEVIKGADAFVGLSKPKTLTAAMIKTMAADPIIFALANPVPEIMPDDALAAGARLVATGRSDFPNQVNNSLAFPGIFRGALDVRARQIDDSMKIAAAHAIAALVTQADLEEGTIIPPAMDLVVPPQVAAAVAEAAMVAGLARRQLDPEDIRNNTRDYLYEGILRIL